jgi:signal transduction histidine kinase
MSTEITGRKKAERQLLQLNRNLEAANLELRSTQEQLIQAEKMESVGRLAAGVAHEVKNPLALILMGVEYLGQLPDDIDPNFLEILDEMRKAVRRAEKIIHGLVDFSASRHLEIQQVDLNQVVRDTLPFIKHDRLRTNVELEISLAEKLPMVAIDVQKFEQVLLNLLINALQAMGRKGGTLRVSTRIGVMAEGDPNDTGSRAAERLRRGDKVVFVSVEDTGCGIPVAEVERIFDPFYTTKPTGEGTGLGLSICRKIVELHGGRISCRSEPGKGTCMTITLRASQSGGQKEKLRDDDGAIQVQSD